MLYFVLIGVIRSVIIGVFLILKFELSLKRFNLVSKIFICRLLSRSFSDKNHELFEGY